MSKNICVCGTVDKIDGDEVRVGNLYILNKSYKSYKFVRLENPESAISTSLPGHTLGIGQWVICRTAIQNMPRVIMGIPGTGEVQTTEPGELYAVYDSHMRLHSVKIPGGQK